MVGGAEIAEWWCLSVLEARATCAWDGLRWASDMSESMSCVGSLKPVFIVTKCATLNLYWQ